MKLKNKKPITLHSMKLLAIFLPIFIFAPFFAHAESIKKQPLHIQFNTPASPKEGIRIIFGNSPNETSKKDNIISNNKNIKLNQTIKYIARTSDHPSSQSITFARQTFNTTLSIKNKTKALANYLSHQNQNPTNAYALFEATTKTDANFDLLALKALLESDLGKFSDNSLTSAKGLFQFTDASWSSLMGKYGQNIGYITSENLKNLYLNQIDNKEKYSNQFKTKLHYAPDISALLKAYQMQEETPILTKIVGVRPSPTDHYLNHMLGLSLASEFYALKHSYPSEKIIDVASDHMKEAIKNNPSFFYDKNHNTLTAVQSYGQFEKFVTRGIERLNYIYDKYTPAEQSF